MIQVFQLKQVIMCYKRTEYNIDVMRQSACLVIYPITVDSFYSLLFTRRLAMHNTQ